MIYIVLASTYFISTKLGYKTPPFTTVAGVLVFSLHNLAEPQAVLALIGHCF